MPLHDHPLFPCAAYSPVRQSPLISPLYRNGINDAPKRIGDQIDLRALHFAVHFPVANRQVVAIHIGDLLQVQRLIIRRVIAGLGYRKLADSGK